MRAQRFLTTAAVNGFECAYEELKGKSPLKRGQDPNFDQMKQLYLAYCQSTAMPPRERTIQTNLNRLKNVMDKAGVTTVGKIDSKILFAKWFGANIPTPSQKRTFSSAIRAAASVFKQAALIHYSDRGISVKNPFTGIELVNPKVQPYSPIPATLRESIWTDCQTELPPSEAMIVLMALGLGMRRREIEHAKLRWFSEQKDKVIVTIQAESKDGFTPKNGETGMVPFSLGLWDMLKQLRGDAKQDWFVPHDNPTPKDRLYTLTTNVCEWLRKKGLNDSKPLHALRKECGSEIARTKSVLEAAKILRQSVQVCSIFYAGISEVTTVDIAGSFQPKNDPFQEVAKSANMTVEQLRARIGI